MDGKFLNAEQRTLVWDTLKLKTTEQALVDRVIDLIESSGAMQKSLDHANDMIESAWAALDAVVPDSFYKINLRAFGYYVLHRHY